MSKYGLKNFLRIADTYVNADTSTLDGIEKWLVSWYMFTYNVPINDPRLLDLTIEELMVLFQMHRIKNDPMVVERELKNNDYEDWLKKMMGEDYLTEEQMQNEVKKEVEEKNKIKELAKQLPDEITTDFSKLHKVLNNE